MYIDTKCVNVLLLHSGLAYSHAESDIRGKQGVWYHIREVWVFG